MHRGGQGPCWSPLAPPLPLLAPAPTSIKSTHAWRDRLLSLPKDQRTTETLSMAAYVLWNIRNERSRRIFQAKELPSAEIVRRSREELVQFNLAYRV
jgi:hypothetical protein